MATWAGDAGVLLKVGLCALPLCAGFYAAQELALRHKMPRAAWAWRLLGRLCLLAAALCLPAGLLILAMS